MLIWRINLKADKRGALGLQLVLISLIIIFLAIILGPVRITASERITERKMQIIELLEKRINHTIKYESIAPSILHVFEIRGLSIYTPDNPDEALLKLDKLRLQFNLFKFRLSNPLNAFSGLTIVNSTINYDRTKQDELARLLNSFSSRPSASGAARFDNREDWRLPSQFSVKGRNLSLKFSGDGITAGIDKIFFTLNPSNSKDLFVSVKAAVSAEILNLPDSIPGNSLNINSDIKIDGRIDNRFQWVDINITTKELKTDIISADKLKWNFKFDNPGNFVLTKTGDNIPADIAVNVDTKQNIVSADFQAQDFIFSRYFQTTGLTEFLEPLTSASLSGYASAAYNFNSSEISYSGDLSFTGLVILPDEPLNLQMDFDGRNKYINIKNSSVSAQMVRAGFSGTVDLSSSLPLVNGRLRVPAINYNGLNISTTLDIASVNDSKYLLNANRILLNDLELGNFSAGITPYEGNIEYELQSEVFSSSTDNGSVYSEGILQTGKDFYIQSLVEIEKLQITPVINALPVEAEMPEFLKDFEISSDLFFTGTLNQLSFASPEINLENSINPNRSLSLSVSGNNSTVRFNDINLSWDKNSLKGKLSTDLTKTGSLIMQSDLYFNNTPLNLYGVIGSGGTVNLSGDYGLKFSLYSLQDAGRALVLKSENLPLKTADGSSSFLSINTTGFYKSLEDWKLLVNSFAFEGFKTGFGNGNIELSALMTQDGGNIYNMSYSDDDSTISGSGGIVLTSPVTDPGGFIQFEAGSLTSPEHYDMLLKFMNNEITGEIEFVNLPVSRLSENLPFTGDVNGNISLSGTVEDPEVRILLNTGNTFINNKKLSLETAFYYKDLVMRIDEVKGTYGNLKLNDFSGAVDLRTGKHELFGDLVSENELLGISTEISAAAKTSSIDSLTNFRKIIEDDSDVDITADKIVINSEIKDKWIINITKREKLVKLIAGVNGEIQGNYFNDGYFTLDIEDPFPVNIKASGTIENGNINAAAKNIRYAFKDLEVPFLFFYEGELNGNLRIQGPLKDPDFFGQLDFSRVVFKPPVVEDISEPFSTSFFLSGKEMTLPATRVETNNGLVLVNGSALMERWLPRAYDLKINVPDKEAVSALFYKSPVYISGFVTGNLHLYGDFSKMHIDGDLNASEAEFMLNSNLDVKEIEGKGNNRNFLASKLHFTLNENNQFFWPRSERPILKGFLKSGNKLDMIFDNATVGLVLNGNLELNGGELFYFERNFYIKEGNINFKNNTLESMDPLLNTRAEIRDINTEGEMTKIFLIIDESPLSSFTPRFESEPSMSTAEIIAILGGNIFDSFGNQDSSVLQEAILLGTDLFTQFALMKGIEDNLKTTLGLDLLSIRSSFLSNFVENTFFTNSDSSAQDNFAKYLDNTTLFLGKYFTNDIFLQGMFQFDLYSDTGYSENPQLNFDSELKLEWEAPVANVELNFYPDFQDPIAGLNKTSVGLSWRFSY